MIPFSRFANAKKNYLSGLENDTILMSRNVGKQIPSDAASHLSVTDTWCKKNSGQPRSKIQANQKTLAANERSLRITASTGVYRSLDVLEVGTKMMCVNMNRGVRNITHWKWRHWSFSKSYTYPPNWPVWISENILSLWLLVIATIFISIIKKQFTRYETYLLAIFTEYDIRENYFAFKFGLPPTTLKWQQTGSNK
jgi:hypothetical protein